MGREWLTTVTCDVCGKVAEYNGPNPDIRMSRDGWTQWDPTTKALNNRVYLVCSGPCYQRAEAAITEGVALGERHVIESLATYRAQREAVRNELASGTTTP